MILTLLKCNSPNWRVAFLFFFLCSFSSLATKRNQKVSIPFSVLSVTSYGKYPKGAAKEERCLKLRIENSFRNEIGINFFGGKLFSTHNFCTTALAKSVQLPLWNPLSLTTCIQTQSYLQQRGGTTPNGDFKSGLKR